MKLKFKDKTIIEVSDCENYSKKEIIKEAKQVYTNFKERQVKDSSYDYRSPSRPKDIEHQLFKLYYKNLPVEIITKVYNPTFDDPGSADIDNIEINYVFVTWENDIINALQDITDYKYDEKYIEENINELFDKYYEQLKESFKDNAIEEASNLLQKEHDESEY